MMLNISMLTGVAGWTWVELMGASGSMLANFENFEADRNAETTRHQLPLGLHKVENIVKAYEKAYQELR